MATTTSSSTSLAGGSYRDPSDIPSSSDARVPSSDAWSQTPAGQIGLSPGTMTSYQQLFCDSDAFRQAVELFKNGPEPDIWLSRLTALVQSLVSPKDNQPLNAWDSVQGYFQGDVDYASLLSTAFTNLNNLIHEYATWFNSLPATQREQYESAGFNIALSGGSQISGSAMPAANVQPSNIIENRNKSFDNVVNFVTSTTDGLLSIVGAVNDCFRVGQSKRQLDLNEYATKKQIENNEKSTLHQINMQRLSLGLSPLQSIGDVSNQDVLDKDSMSQYAVGRINAADIDSKTSRVKLDTEVNPLYDATDNQFRLGTGPFNEITATLGNIQLAQKLYDFLYNREKQEFDLSQLRINKQIQEQYGGSIAEGAALNTLEEQSAKSSEFKKSKLLSDFGKELYDYKKQKLTEWIKKANSGDNDAFIYSSLLMKSGLNFSDFMGPMDVGLDYLNKATDSVGDILDTFNPFKIIKGFLKSPGKGKSKK